MRLTFAAVAWLGLAAAAVFLFHSEKQLNERRIAARAFDLRAREAAGALNDVRAAQEAYVAAGQGVAFWIAKVTSTVETASRLISSLSDAATAAPAKDAAAEASRALSDFAAVDGRVRDYLKSDQQLMAADVIFTEGGQTIASAAQQVEAARLAEREAEDAAEAAARKLEAATAGAAAAFAGLLLIVFAARPKVVATEPLPAADPESAAEAAEPTLLLRQPAVADPTPARVEPPAAPAAPVAVPLKSAADVCTEFARVRDAADLTALLGRAAAVVGARGIIVWLGSAAGEDLRPVLAHGYAPQALARMPAVPRSGENAAARAYRTGETQIVPARPGAPDAALVVPLLSADGCVGALSLEMAHRTEPSEHVQALAAIFAAQLAAVVGGAQPAETAAPKPAARRA